MYFCCRVMVLDQQEYISKRNSISIETLNIAWYFYGFDLSKIDIFEKLIDVLLYKYMEL